MLKLYNSLTQNIETFKPIEDKKVSMYVCGPTVYGDIHIGNARPVIFFDLLKRYFTFIDYDVLYVSNITDVDDRIILKAQELNLSESEVAKTYTNRFIEMTHTVNSMLPDHMPKATEYVANMVTYIQDLIDLGYAYIVPSGIYFRVTKIKNYGILSKQNIEELEEGVRITLEDEKEDPRDFTLWKFTKDGLRFPSPWGFGRPGWHTECAVMNKEIFKGEIDIHGGGADLKFPHHENEIAQACAHDHHNIAKYWMHVGRLNVDSIKMSKSIGNITLVKEIVKDFDPLAFRFFIIAQHYRQPINYSNDLMMQFSKEYDRIKRSLKKAYLSISVAKAHQAVVLNEQISKFKEIMDDDINTPNVITQIYELVKLLNKETDPFELSIIYQTIKTILDVLGIMPTYEITDDMLLVFKDWQQAREDKDYKRADQLREELSRQGWM
jgi:cysteinyl-tRNA synthetase